VRPTSVDWRSRPDAGLDRASPRFDLPQVPRLVRFRESIARGNGASYRDWTYWGRPCPGSAIQRQAPHVGLAPRARWRRTARARALHRQIEAGTGSIEPCIGPASQSTGRRSHRRRIGLTGLLHRRVGAVRAASKQADKNRVRPLSTLPRTRAHAPPTGPGGSSCSGPSRCVRSSARGSRRTIRSDPRLPKFHHGGSWSLSAGHPDCIVPSEPTKHANRPPDGADVRSGLPRGATNHGGPSRSRPIESEEVNLKTRLTIDRGTGGSEKA